MLSRSTLRRTSPFSVNLQAHGVKDSRYSLSLVLNCSNNGSAFSHALPLQLKTVAVIDDMPELSKGCQPRGQTIRRRPRPRFVRAELKTDPRTRMRTTTRRNRGKPTVKIR